MSHNDANDYAQRLYARVPAHYRAYDEEQGQPLLALLRVVGEQVANLRQDLDALWDNFFIETCDDWVVPYIGALLGTHLLAHPVGQSNRLDVWNTISWRRSKGTPAMLRALATAISGWPTDLAEFFQMLGWSQNMNHLRLAHPLTPDLHDLYQLSLLGLAADPFAHAADFKPSRPLDQSRILQGAPGIGDAAWGTPGRYQIKNLGFFVHRLQTFALKGVTPAAVAPGAPAQPNAACFTFDPLFQETPLFVEKPARPLSRAAFDHAPWETFGKDVGVRQFGVLLASDSQPTPDLTSSLTPFSFGGSGAGLALHAMLGMRLLEPGAFQQGSAHFIITAAWQDSSNTITPLGTLSTLLAAQANAAAYHQGATATAAGQLVITVEPGHSTGYWTTLPVSPPAHFPGAVLAVRVARTGAWHADDALYIYLPPAFITAGQTLTCYVADDGSTYTTTPLDVNTLARAAEGQVYPARPFTASTQPASGFTVLNRQAGGLIVADQSRFGNAANRAAMLIEVDLFTGAFQPLGAVATIDQPKSGYPDLQIPNPWKAFTYGPSLAAINDTIRDTGLLSILLKPLAGNTFSPEAELIITNRSGQSLLVYLPELTGLTSDGVRLFVAEDGSTYRAPPDNAGQMAVSGQQSLKGLTLLRSSAGQVLPISGAWPLQQRKPVAINLCRCERSTLLAPGELGIDPELGRFALAPGDPAIGQGSLSVNYVEAFSDRVGARTFDRQLDPKAQSTRLVAQSGDASSPLNPQLASDHIHASVTDALAQAQDGDVIEIVDSATYAASAELLLPALKKLTLRAAAGQRPCLTFYQSASTPTSASLRIKNDMDRLELSGLLFSGGPLLIDNPVQQLLVTACTLDPRSARGTPGSLITTDTDLNHHCSYLFCRCISGGLRVGAGVSHLTVADSLVDERGGVAIGGAPVANENTLPLASAAQNVHLERVTVWGRVRCDVLSASESIFDDLIVVDDQQAGCIRFSRYESGSVLPRRFQCVPNDMQMAACSPGTRCVGPLFNSRQFGRPDYGQLAAACPQAILTASEERSEIGAFASRLNTIRLENLMIKLREFLPVSLVATIIAET